ncbi:MAG: hypothetical protein U0793_01125 [Gemmataceae bacterium]
MKAQIGLLSVAIALIVGGSPANAQAPPTEWVDATTGHRVIRLSGDGGGSSLYFHQNSYTPKGDKLAFDTKGGIAVVDLTRLEKQLGHEWRNREAYDEDDGSVVDW